LNILKILARACSAWTSGSTDLATDEAAGGYRRSDTIAESLVCQVVGRSGFGRHVLEHAVENSLLKSNERVMTPLFVESSTSPHMLMGKPNPATERAKS
jgi:hypothetical protein